MARKYNITYKNIEDYLFQIRSVVRQEAYPVQFVISFIGGNLEDEIASIANSDYCRVVEKLTNDELISLSCTIKTLFTFLYRLRHRLHNGTSDDLWDHV